MNTFTIIEISLISIVILTQISVFIKLRSKILRLKKIFKPVMWVVSGILNLDRTDEYDFANMERELLKRKVSGAKCAHMGIIKTESTNEISQNIVGALNMFLVKNQGRAVSFELIKDIIDREIDAEYEEIEQNIPTPLYLGLGATMIGIVAGLWSMSNLGSDTDSISGIFTVIDAVKIAMIASFTGLAFTTWLSADIYRRVRKLVSRAQNDQLSILQANLLPVLAESEIDSLVGLKHSLDNFAIAAKPLSDNIDKQVELLDRFEELNYSRLVKETMQVFNKMETGMDGLTSFSQYLDKLGKISTHLDSFAQKAKNIEQLTEGISQTINGANTMQNFIGKHFQEIDTLKNRALHSVGEADSKITGSIEVLQKGMATNSQELQAASSKIHADIIKLYGEIEKHLTNALDGQLKEFQKACTEKGVEFGHLKELSSMPKLVTEIKDGNKKLVEKLESVDHGNAMIAANISDLSSSIKQLASLKLNVDKWQPGYEAPKRDSVAQKAERVLKYAAFSGLTIFGIRELLLLIGLI